MVKSVTIFFKYSNRNIYYLSPLTISLDLLPLIKTKYLRTKQHNCFARQMRSFLEIPQFYIRGHYRHMKRASNFLKMKQGGWSNHFAMVTSLRERVRCRDVRCNWPPAIHPGFKFRSQPEW